MCIIFKLEIKISMRVLDTRNNLRITINIHIIYVTMFLEIYRNQYKFFQLLSLFYFPYKNVHTKFVKFALVPSNSVFILRLYYRYIEEPTKRSIPRSSPVLGLIPLWNVEEPDCRGRAWISPGCYLRGINHIAGKKRSFL